MKRNNIKPIISLTAVLVLMAGIVSGCTFDQGIDEGPVAGKDITIEMRIPDAATPVTRSIEEGKGEAKVKVVDLLIFDNSAKPKLLQHHKVHNPTQNGSGPDYTVSFSLKLDAIANAGTVAVVANASGEVDAALVKAPITSEKQNVLAELKFSTAASNGSYKWDVSSDYTPIPMYGEKAVSGITSSMRITDITLVRMLARIDVENNVPDGTFDLSQIYVVNYNTAGYIAPAWNIANGALLKEGDASYPYSTNKNPMIPGQAGKQPGTPGSSMLYDDTQGIATWPDLVGEIYTYEAVKGTGDEGNDADNTPCLIIKGVYEGREYYYRVDFTTTRKGSDGVVEYMPLYRNHKYIVTIAAVEGIGYTSFEEALRSTTVLSNLKTKIMVIDLTGIKDIIFDGQYFVGVEDSDIPVLWGINKSWTQTVSTNFSGEWKAEITNPAIATWLRFTGNRTEASGSKLNDTGIGIEVTALPVYGQSADGEILLTAGRLRMTLTVKRVSIADLFARSNVVMQGGDKLTFAVTATDNATIPAWSQGVYFKWGSLFAVAPPGNPYDPSTHVIYNPSPGIHTPSIWGNGLEGWDKIPYAHTKFGFPESAVSNPDDKDEFKTYNGDTGFDKDAGIGDICRYITSNTGWVEGQWRMPTYAEMLMLQAETNSDSPLGDFKDKTASLNSAPGIYLYGTFNPLSGWFLGGNVSSSTSSIANAAVPPEGTIYLPAGGHRYPNGDGDVVQVGAYGYYWTSTPYDKITVNYPLLNKYGIWDYDADRSYAFPVRCIRDY